MALPGSPGPGSAPAVLRWLRSGLVVAGLLLLGVGVGDTVAGRIKIAQYEELLRTTPVPPPLDPTALFPTATEGRERQDLARTKLAFYHLLVTAGTLLSALGFGLIAIGILRVRARTAVRADLPAAN
jgi:hypothetical protein